MDIIGIAAIGIFVAGYVLITLEQKFGTHKSAIALIMGCLLWMLAAVALQDQPEELKHALSHAGNEIFGIVAFLLGAMALIEILVHYGLFDAIRIKLSQLKVTKRQQFLVMMTMVFFLSALLDNISVTIAMLQIARRFFDGKNLLVAAAGIVIAANAGGAWSPIGDVTTILLWLAGKFTAFEVIQFVFVPAFALFVTATALLYRKLNSTDFLEEESTVRAKLSRGELLVIGTATASFLLPIFMNFIGLPPYIGLLFGLGVTWMVVELEKHRVHRRKYSRLADKNHLTANIEHLLQTVDLASIKFIIGILLSVSALGAIGVLVLISHAILGDAPSESALIGMNIGIGLLSSVVDNSSLVAMMIGMIEEASPVVWSLLALTAGTGGSILLIGSPAGVVASGIIKKLNFQEYLKIATVPAFVGLVVGIAVWMVQHVVL